MSHNSIRIYRVDLGAGQDVKDSGNLAGGVATLPKTLVFDSASLNGVLNTYENKIDNIEGMTFGPRLPNGHASMVLVSDNNNSNSQGKTQFVVFAVNSPIPEVQFWDGDGQHMADGAVGGDGVWRAGGTLENWTREGGWVNDAWGGKQAVFAGSPGTVTVDGKDGEIAPSGLRFLSDGYRLQGDALRLKQPDTGILVDGKATLATIAAPLRGEGGLRKTGAGTLVLAGDSDYSGPTRVDAGTLSVEGALASAVSVADQARLSGRGRVGAATIASGGILDPAGSAIGTLTVDGKLTMAAGARLDVDLDATRADRLQAGSIALAGGEVFLRAQGVDAGSAAFRPADRYQILAAKGGLSGRLGGVHENFAYLTALLSYDANSVWLSFDRTPQKLAPVAYTRSLVEQYDALRKEHPQIAGPLYPGYNGGGVAGTTPRRDDHNMQVVRDYRRTSQARRIWRSATTATTTWEA
ncbi:esterase-like activity of phytase family protein [Xanthomonas theicola]|uniref:esterase-like activity of phytase family protein n=1 Tax=Xanthomonas theicola TaxID=56464 RepID=UPI00361E7352